jgi:mannose-1-phosphate guanylyltransferase
MSQLSAVIQAGGRGTRLAPYSTVLPKALMPIGDGTVVDRLLEQFSAAGVKKAYITVGNLAALIRSYCGDGSRWGIPIEYVHEDQPLGTIGPLSALRDQLDAPFLVTNSDVYADVNFKDVLEFHADRPGPVTVVVTEQQVSIPYGVIDHSQDRLTAFREKPVEQFSVSTGIYCMQPEVFDYIPEGRSYGFDRLMHEMLGRNACVNVYMHHGQWVDIGRIEDLRRAQEDAAAQMSVDRR